MVNEERVATEREAMLYRIDQHAEQAREEAMRSRVREWHTSLSCQLTKSNYSILSSDISKIRKCKN